MLWVAPGRILGCLPFLPDAFHFAHFLFILVLLPLKRRASPPPETAVNASVSSSIFSFSSSSSSSGKSRINSTTCSAEVSMPFSAAAFKINPLLHRICQLLRGQQIFPLVQRIKIQIVFELRSQRVNTYLFKFNFDAWLRRYKEVPNTCCLPVLQ